MSPKRKQGEDGDILYPGHLGRPRRKVTVLDIRDLEGEYLLVLARLQLIKVDADPTRATGLKHKCWTNRFKELTRSLIQVVQLDRLLLKSLTGIHLIKCGPSVLLGPIGGWRLGCQD